MGSRERHAIIGTRRGRDMTQAVLRELHDGRLDRNLSGRTVGAALGISPSEYSRIERGLTRGVTIEQLTVLLAAVGLDLSVRAYPGG
ncbi:MAG TPA: helix-turn-helix transcriptional regulator [Candidatus Limnocylindrales bacterium]|nr:helix-turn-helix transcriptional regulator [Candidatus Limnocylindrales bacterium]